MNFKSLSLLIVCLLLVVLVTFVGPAWRPGVIENDLHSASALDGETRQWLLAEMQARGIPGMSIAVIVDGKVVSVDALGVSDYWTRTPLQPDSLMEVASNSKVVTALAAAREVAAGTLNLDQPLSAYRPDFDLEGEYADQITLKMLLTHSAGLGNALGHVPSADLPPGQRFQYSGEGFELVGSLIADNAGTDLPAALRSSVLEPLGISGRATYAQVGDGNVLASPHGSITLPLLLFLLPLSFVFGLLAIIVWLLGRFGLLNRWPDSILLLTMAMLVALALPFMLLPIGNALRFALVDVIFAGAVILSVLSVRQWRKRRSIQAAVVAVILILSLVFSVFWRIPVPLQERTTRFPAAAGLRASARDMGQLLAALVRPPAGWEQVISRLTQPRVRVNDQNSWGLGIGIQQMGGREVIWHWGVNFPGYQSLMLGLPDSGDGLVVLMNGGPMTMTLEGPRFSGLELARELAGRVLPGPHGAYWHGVQ